MRNLILIYILLLGTSGIFAQSCDFTKNKIATNSLCSLLSSLPSGDATLTARDEIVFMPGFDANGANFNGHTFRAAIDHSVANQTANYLSSPIIIGSTNTLDKTNFIPGTIGGNIDISPTGAATYQLPIQVSPGTHGMQPKLSIVYNSQSGNDILGYGWHLSGLSVISRVNKNPYYDGAYAGVSLSASDALAMDGERLISIGSNTYSPENNPYTIVQFNGTSFTVTTQDGTIMEYGNTSDSRFTMYCNSNPVTWAINKVSDPDGNYMQFVYLADNITGKSRITEINYTGNSKLNMAPYNSVQFFYDKRTDVNTIYTSGALATQNLLLTGIKVMAEGTVSKDYEFTYFNDGLYSKLNQISLSADGVSYNPTIVSWAAPDYSATVSDAGSVLGSLHNGNQLLFGDINGDGRTDIVIWDRKKTITVSIAKPGGGYTSYPVTLSIAPSVNTTGDSNNTYTNTHTYSDPLDIQIVDWNNDGKDEIMVHYTDKYERDVSPHPTTIPNAPYEIFTINDKIDICAFNGSQINASPNYSTVAGTYINAWPTGSTYKYYYADFNHDGSIDRLKIKDGILNGCDGLTLSSLPNIIIDDVKLMDVDGDGQLEFLALTNDGNGSIYKYNGVTFVDMYTNTGKTRSFWGKPANIFVGDFNGDGKTDILRFSNTSTWEILYSQGVISASADFVSAAAPSGMENYEPAKLGVSDPNKYAGFNLFPGYVDPIMYYYVCYKPATSVYVGDINDDGKADIIYALNDNVTTYLSNGSSFVPILQKSASSADPTSLVNIYLNVMDIDSNGKKEIIYCNDDNPYYYWINENSFNDGYKARPAAHQSYQIVEFTNNLQQAELVSSITDGNNINSAITYTPTFTNVAGTRNYPVIPITWPMNLATNVITTDLTTGVAPSNTTYTYTNGYIHAQGKGFLGFTTVTSSDAVSGSSKISNYNFRLPGATGVYYTWLSSQSASKNRVLLSTQTYNMGYYSGDITKKFYFPLVTSASSTDNLKGFTTTNTIISFDAALGRITDQKTTTSDGWGIDTKSTYESVSGNISRLIQVTKTNTLGSDTYTDAVVNSYIDSTYPLHLTSSVKQGLITNNYGYDNFGNIINQSVVTSDGTRSTSSVYESKGRFVYSSTDAAGYTSYATHRPCDGATLTQTNINNLVTSYSYTVQNGSIITKVDLPDGNSTTTTLGWENAQQGNLYFIQSQVSHGKTVTDYYMGTGQKNAEISTGYKEAELWVSWTYNPDGTLINMQKCGYADPFSYSYFSDGRTKTVTGPNLNKSYSYSNNSVTVTNNISGETKTQTFDALGNVTQVNGTNGQITYNYFASGKVKSITTGNTTTSMTYDPLGNQRTLNDPDAGVTTYTYNGFGQLHTQTDAKLQIVTCTYDDAGRLISKSSPGTNSTYVYYTTSGKLGLLQTATRDGVTKSLDYDGLGRPVMVTTTGAGKTFVTSLQYDINGRLFHTTYPTGLTVEYGYDDVGNLSQIFDYNNKTLPLWSGDVQNDKGQWTNFSQGNGLATTWGYDANNYTLNSIQTGPSSASNSIMNLGFTFNNQGQLTNRTDGALSESFVYDPMDRLKTATVSSQPAINSNYLDNGNIDNTSIAGQYTYVTSQPHAVQNVAGPTSTGQASTLVTTSTFTSDNKLSEMDNGTYKNMFSYGPDENRFKVDMYNGGSLQSSKLYDGSNEFVLDNSGNITYSRTFIYAPTGICAVYEKDATNVGSFYYIHTDYLGSWLAITNQQGSLTNRYSYDAWGRPRNPSTWQLMPVSITNALADLSSMQPRFDRGYTGHEHMAGFGLINMNGRLYDPYLQRFLSADNKLQDPSNMQNYNRYTYCLNNPLRYIDPTGFTVQGPGDGNEGGDEGNDYTDSQGNPLQPQMSPTTYDDFVSMLIANAIPGFINSNINVTIDGTQVTFSSSFEYKGLENISHFSFGLNTRDISDFSPLSFLTPLGIPQIETTNNSHLDFSPTGENSNSSQSDAQSEGDISGSEGQYNPSITLKTTTHTVLGGIAIDSYSTKTKEGSPFVEITYSTLEHKYEGTTINGGFGTNISIGADGSLLYGIGSVSVGSSPENWLIIDLALPWFGETSKIGTTLSLSKQPWENLGNYFKSINYHFVPVAPSPFYLAPAFGL